MFEKCPKCGRMHYRTDPCGATKPSANVEGPRATQVIDVGTGGRTKSTAARMDVRERSDSDAVTTALGQSVEKGRIDVLPAAGTQAPPVDTIPKPSGRPRSIKPSEGKSKRAAEMRNYMRQYRARKKADER